MSNGIIIPQEYMGGGTERLSVKAQALTEVSNPHIVSSLNKNITVEASSRVNKVTITMKAYRNDETYMQDLPSMELEYGQFFRLYNDNAPTIDGYDFVCCSNNNKYITEDIEVRVFYIPQSVADRTRTDWSRRYDEFSVSDCDFANTFNAENMQAMFNECRFYSPLIDHPININMSNVINIANMFMHAMPPSSSSEDSFLLDLSNWDTYNLTSTASMFGDADFSNTKVKLFSTPNVTNMQYMFGWSNFIEIDMSNFDTSKVTNMNSMFEHSEFDHLDVSNFNTSKVTDMGDMFFQSSNLTTLDISSFDTSKVISMNKMFAECPVLTTITGTIDMSSCTNCEDMFYSSPNLKGVHLKNVPRSLDMSGIGGTEGVTYIIDNYID